MESNPEQNFIPIVKPFLPQDIDSIISDTKEILDSGMLSKGKHLRDFEETLASYLGVEHIVAMSSCTMGLLLTYSWLSEKKDTRKQVLVPSFTFMATVHPLKWVGLEPVFVDIDSRTWNVSIESIENSIKDDTLAIVAVHNFGNPAPIEELSKICDQYNLSLIFDSAHGFGSLYKGKRLGSFGDAEIFSLTPTKLLVGGEGGVVSTNNKDLADYLRLGREYGNPGDYGSVMPGLNARLPEFNAMLAKHGISGLESQSKMRNQIAEWYREDLSKIDGIEFQEIEKTNVSSYKDLNINVIKDKFGMDRDLLAKNLLKDKIDTRKYHYPAVHTHQTYSDTFNFSNPNLPITNSVSEQCLSLPIWAAMDRETVSYITSSIKKYRK